MGSHGTAGGVQGHHARQEPLCRSCSAYLARLQNEAFRPQPSVGEDIIELTVRLPRSIYWQLMTIAEESRRRVDELIVDEMAERVGVSKRPTISFAKERQIRAMWLDGESTAAIAREVKVSEPTVAKRITSWGGTANGRKKTNKKEKR